MTSVPSSAQILDRLNRALTQLSVGPVPPSALDAMARALRRGLLSPRHTISLLAVHSLDEALDFYCGRLGFEVMDRADISHEPGNVVLLARDGIGIGLISGRSWLAPESRTAVYAVSDAVAVYRSFAVALTAGALDRGDLDLNRTEQRPMTVVTDPWGQQLCFVETGRRIDVLEDDVERKEILPIPSDSAFEAAMATASHWCGPLLTPDRPGCTVALDPRLGGAVDVFDSEGQLIRRGAVTYRDPQNLALTVSASASEPAVEISFFCGEVDDPASSRIHLTVWGENPDKDERRVQLQRAMEGLAAAAATVDLTADNSTHEPRRPRREAMLPASHAHAKQLAHTLRDTAGEAGIALRHGTALELVAQAVGYRDWNTLSALIGAGRLSTGDPGPGTGEAGPVGGICPLLRVDDLAAALAEYEAYGFSVLDRSHADVTVIGNDATILALSTQLGARAATVWCGEEPFGQNERVSQVHAIPSSVRAWDDSDNRLIARPVPGVDYEAAPETHEQPAS